MAMKFHQLQLLLVFLSAFHFSECNRQQNSVIVQKRVNEMAVLKCPLERPATFVEWHKDGEAVIENSDVRMKKDDLRISNLRHYDQGFYSCRGVDGYGSQPWSNFSLIVYDADVETFPENPVLETSTERPNMGPRFVDNPPGQREVQFSVGASPKIRCRVESYPHASIDWTKNGRPIDYQAENIAKEGFALKFQSVLPKHEGRYTCRVYNGYGSINFTYTLTVTDPNLPSAKVIPPYPLNTSVTFGSAASLQCKVRSNSRPTIMWLKQTYGNTYSIEIHNKKYRIIKNETMSIETEEGAYLNRLVIPNVKMEDAGVYVCFGINTGGGSDMREALLTVVNGPVMATTTQLPAFTDSSWEHIFGSPSATLAVLIAIPVVIILIVTIAVIYGLNKRKKSKRGIRRPTANMSDHEVAVPLNMNANNGCYSGQYVGGSTSSYKAQLPAPEPRYTDKLYKPPSYRTNTPQQYSQYFQSDGSYRSSLHYPQQGPPHHQGYLQDIPDSDSHFSSVSHTRPQYMNNSRNPYDDRDIHSDPAASRAGGHHCPPPPPSSYYSEQW